MNFSNLIKQLECAALVEVEDAVEASTKVIFDFLQQEMIPALEAKIVASESKIDDYALPIIAIGKNYLPTLQTLVLQYVDKIDDFCPLNAEVVAEDKPDVA